MSTVPTLLSAWHSAIVVEEGERRPNPQEKVSNSRPMSTPCGPAERPLQNHRESGEQEDHDRATWKRRIFCLSTILASVQASALLTF